MAKDITQLLLAHAEGDQAAMAELLRLVYDELRRQAAYRMANRPPGQTLQATALVHEVFARLVERDRVPTASRAHFFAAAASAMRDVLVEAARKRNALKRGGGRGRVDLDDATLAIAPPSDDLPAISDALDELEQDDVRAANIVKLKFFVGMTEPEIAEALSISERSVRRDWSYARAWLYQRLGGELPSSTENT